MAVGARGETHPTGVVIGVLIALWTTAQIHRFTVAAFIGASTIMADFGVTATGAGLLAAIYFPAYGVMQVPSGIMADVLRPKTVLVVGGLLFAASAAAFALAASFEAALAARAAIGLTAGLLWLSSLKLCAGLRDVSYPRAVSLMVSLGSLGTVGALAGLPVLVSLMSWRSAALLLTVPIVAACLALTFVRVPEPAPVGGGPTLARLRGRVAESMRGLRIVLADRRYWVIFLPGMMWNGGQFAIVSWLPRYARDVLGLPPSAVGLLPALMPIGLIVGSWCIGWWQARRPAIGMRPFYANVVLWTGLLAVLASGRVEMLGPAGLMGLMLAMGLLYGSWYMSLARTGQLAGPALLGTATGVANGLGFFPGFAYPWVMGMVMDAVDRPPSADWVYSAAAFQAGFAVVLVGSVLSLAAVAVLARGGATMATDTGR